MMAAAFTLEAVAGVFNPDPIFFWVWGAVEFIEAAVDFVFGLKVVYLGLNTVNNGQQINIGELIDWVFEMNGVVSIFI